jgi:hypothetical protein
MVGRAYGGIKPAAEDILSRARRAIDLFGAERVLTSPRGTHVTSRRAENGHYDDMKALRLRAGVSCAREDTRRAGAAERRRSRCSEGAGVEG